MSDRTIMWLTAIGLVTLANGTAYLGDGWLPAVAVGVGAGLISGAVRGLAQRLREVVR